ncbi:hypothetical protein [Candidatus Thioglobus sp.]|uniref:hypothetical protein n=1 Tax=Candidatus Thioglobus sp. TaxID=2026721 RepID=UPI002602F4A3|nr:hypothetical protein [Candidatus Thioglobus sp.]MDG2395429.1 hypothetical protein [Candidatus Thioglobus sp.]
MKKVNLFFIIIGISSVNASAFFNTDSMMPFATGTGYNNSVPWSNNANWNPMSGNGQYSPANDARNMSRYGARPTSLKSYRQNPTFIPNNAMVIPSQAQPSNWLQDTDFSKTLEQITHSTSKTFFVDEMPINLGTGIQNFKDQSREIEKAVGNQLHYSGNSDSIYGKQGYGLSPAASTTSRVLVE